jgi:hypothetical protein
MRVRKRARMGTETKRRRSEVDDAARRGFRGAAPRAVAAPRGVWLRYQRSSVKKF